MCREIGDVKTGVGDFAILYMVHRERLCEEVTFELRPKEVRK